MKVLESFAKGLIEKGIWNNEMVVTLLTPYLLSAKYRKTKLLIDFSLTVKAATLIFISGRGSAISSAKGGKSGSIYNLVKN